MENIKSSVHTGIRPQDVQYENNWAKLYYELFDNIFYEGLSLDAIVLYCLMRDRVSLSLKNEKINEHGIIYIYFSYQQIMDKCRCSKPKAGKLLKELINYNLIITEQQGKMQPNRIYVQPFNCRNYDVKNKRFIDIPKDYYKLTIRKPNQEQINTFAQSFGNNLYLDPEEFYIVNTTRNWLDHHGEEIKNWKGLFTSWNERLRRNNAPKFSFGQKQLSSVIPYDEVKENMSYEEYLDKYFPIDPKRDFSDN